MHSNLTYQELMDMIGGAEYNSQLLQYIKSVTNEYCQTYGWHVDFDDMNERIKRNILLKWKGFYDKHGNSRIDMNYIMERAIENNLHITGLPRSYGTSRYDLEVVALNREISDKLMQILEVIDPENTSSLKKKKSKKKPKKPKKPKKKKSKKHKKKKPKK